MEALNRSPKLDLIGCPQDDRTSPPGASMVVLGPRCELRPAVHDVSDATRPAAYIDFPLEGESSVHEDRHSSTGSSTSPAGALSAWRPGLTGQIELRSE